MPLLNTADKIYIGSTAADAVYFGADKVWPPAPASGFDPSDIAGLAVWLDASQLGLADGATVSPWPDLSGGGHNGVVVGSPAPAVRANALNGKPVVRFKVNEGRIRGDNGCTVTPAGYNFSIIYVARMVGPSVGRVLAGAYPEYTNFLVGYHTSGTDLVYDGAFIGTPAGYPGGLPEPWKLFAYQGSHNGAVYETDFYINGTRIGGLSPTGNGFGLRYHLGGYSQGGVEETCDSEVAELLIYNRKLDDAERQQAEDYLRDKWWKPPLDPATVAYLAATGLDASYAPALDGLVVGLKDAGLWTKMKAVYPFIGGTAALHRWNLIDPRDLDAAYRLTFLNGGTHSEALGYRPNEAIHDAGGGGHADTHLVPLDVLAGPSDTHLALYSLLDVPVGPRCDFGCYNWNGAAARFHIIACYVGNQFYFGQCESGASSTAVPNSSGLFVATRTAADNQAAYRNGALLYANSNPPVALPGNMTVRVGGIGGYDREFSNLPFGFASIGSSLTTQNVADLYTVVQAFQTALGRQVAP